MTEWIRGTFHVVAVFPMSLPCLITTLLYVCAVLTIDTCLAYVFALVYFYVAMFLRRLYLPILLALWPESRVHIKTVFSGMVIPVLKMRRSWESRIFNMGIPILGRRRLYIETAPRLLDFYVWYWQGARRPYVRILFLGVMLLHIIMQNRSHRFLGYLPCNVQGYMR